MKSKTLRRLQRGARNAASNAIELLREGRLGAPYRAPFDRVTQGRHHGLRRYHRDPDGPLGAVAQPLVLVPPLMVTSEIYDISPELSAVTTMTALGLDVWLVDFGAPEAAEGGLARTLDDHVLAVDAAIAEVAAATGHPVHLAGYSQGGMFVYQAAAYRRARDIASVVTFGAPVDIHRNLPVKVHDSLAERLIRVARKAVSGPLDELEGLPGVLTAAGFKLLSPRQEVKQLVGLLGLLPDREALERREPKRRFLGGEGFVAWPGPAFRQFVDAMVVENRMASGGFVVAGRTVSLADITCPVLAFVGERDDLARPASVRAIRKAAPAAEVHDVAIDAGHFGLVVGSKAMTEVWPCVADWIAWKAGQGDPPALLGRAGGPAAPLPAPPPGLAPPDDAPKTQLLYDLATSVVDGLWHRLGDVSLEVAGLVDGLRYQLPRLARLESLHDGSRVSIGRALAEQAEAIPDATFFLWQGRAYTWAEADRRVNQVLAALVGQGVRRGHHVGVLMDNGPDFLTVVAAVSRLGAVSVLLNAGMRGRSLAHALAAGEVDVLVVDPAHAEVAADAFAPTRAPTGDASGRAVLALGATDHALLPEGVVHLDPLLDPTVTAPPADLPANPGRARDLALLLFTSGTTGLPKAARITNRRWALAALGSAAACGLTPRDTVYCCLPLHHATGILVAVGGALVGGARLALAPRFSQSTFWNDVRRYGATVVFYVGELCRYLVASPVAPNEHVHPARLFVGNGMRPQVWQRLLERFGPVRVLEFYGSTEGNVALANLTGDKVGSVGRAVLGATELALVRYDVAEERYVRDGDGRLTPVATGQPGALIARISDVHPLARFDGYTDERATDAKVLRDVFAPGDAWFATGDLLRQDADGDYWFVDRIGDTFRWKGENVSTDEVAEVLMHAPGIALAAVYGVALPGREGRAGMAAVQLTPGASFDGEAVFRAVQRDLFPAARPRFVRVVEALETTDSLKVVKHHLQAEGADPGRTGDALYWLDEAAERYSPLDMDGYARLVESER